MSRHNRAGRPQQPPRERLLLCIYCGESRKPSVQTCPKCGHEAAEQVRVPANQEEDHWR